MNQHLQNILNFIHLDKNLSDEEKNTLTKSLDNANKELELTAFKLDRTEKVKRTTAILLEETIEELEQKQKAVEAQKRELEIETSLEKVRSRTSAMQKSEELGDVAEILFKQIKELGIHPWSAGFNIWLEGNEKYIDWITDPSGGFVEPYLVDLTMHPGFRQISDAKKRGEDFKVFEISGTELVETYMLLTSFAPKQFAKMKAIAGNSFPSRQYNHYYFGTQVGLMFITPEPHPEDWDIFKRFGQVFEQTYTRFLDLKKAEEQARESKIEASLERVRSKTMAMHNSQDVGETVALMFEELVKLGVKTNRCGILIISNSMIAEVWTAKSNSNGKASLIIGKLDLTMHPLLQGFYQAWKNKESLFTYPMIGDDLISYYQAINNTKYYPTLFDLNALPSKEFHTDFYFAEGSIFSFTDEILTEEATIIFKRFAGVFGQTYRRYLDLQKAEAQTRESQIETALERVRSRTLAMQKSDELAETAVVVFKQLINLGIEPNRLYIGIIKEDNNLIEFWITDEDGSKVINQFTADANKNGSMKKMYKAWKEQEKSLTIEMEGKELVDYFQYLSSDLHVPFKQGLSQKKRIQNIAFFGKGFIGMASPEVQPEASIHLLERFTAVFNLTFTRFNDLQIAEHHAEQATLDLIQLQTEKKRAEDALKELRSTQTQLIQSEKMASLGELTAGIAHEIQNPLNFVNNFSEVSTELIDEMNEEILKGNLEDAQQIAADLKENLTKINHHGKRAGDIVRGMLQHSRSSSGQKEPTDINALADEYLRLAYHGLRAKDKSFNATLHTDFDQSIGLINIIPQDIGRVILNLITNAFYVVDEKKKSGIENYEPTVSVSTKKIGDKILISVKDNGNGIPSKVLDKIFQPFFTTKPTGQGTGLGLSLSYDIVKAHGGELKVETKTGEGTEFIIQLPII
jgi:signal transduction histidine kinase